MIAEEVSKIDICSPGSIYVKRWREGVLAEEVEEGRAARPVAVAVWVANAVEQYALS